MGRVDTVVPAVPIEQRLATPSAITMSAAERRDRLWRRAFYITMAIFAVVASIIAATNRFPGSFDSTNNLATARNLAEGRGFVTDFVQDLAFRHPVPGQEIVRAPGIPFLMAALYKIFGVSLALHVLVNAIAVVLAALLLRAAIRADGGGWVGDLAGIWIFASHGTFELRSITNNVALVCLTAALLLVAVRVTRDRMHGWPVVLWCAVLTAVGFLMKQTFMLGAIPFSLLLLATSESQPRRTRAIQCAAFMMLFATLTAPYWLTNVMRYGDPLYGPIHNLRLPTRYGILVDNTFHRTVHFDAPKYTYATIIREIGLRNVVKAEAVHAQELVMALLGLSPLAMIWAAGGALFFRKRDWRLVALAVCLCLAPVFDTLYWVVEPRYLWPVLPCVLFLGWLGVRGFHDWGRAQMSVRLADRWRRAFAGVVAAGLLLALVPSLRQWRWDLIAARLPAPEWVPIVSALPANTILLTQSPPDVSWWARRRSVIAPIGPRSDLARVLETYRPEYYLDLEPYRPDRALSFAPGDLEPLQHGDYWGLYRILGPVRGEPAPARGRP